MVSVELAATASVIVTPRLQSLAAEGPVLLPGHGIMNQLIARPLEAAGWTRQRNGNSATAYRLRQA